MHATKHHRDRDAKPVPTDIAEKMIALKRKQARYVSPTPRPLLCPSHYLPAILELRTGQNGPPCPSRTLRLLPPGGNLLQGSPLRCPYLDMNQTPASSLACLQYPPPKNLYLLTSISPNSMIPQQIPSLCDAPRSPRLCPSPLGVRIPRGLMRMLQEIGTLHNIDSCSIIESMTPSTSPQPKRGNQRLSTLATMLPFLQSLPMQTPSFLQISPSRQVPPMAHLRLLRSSTTNPARSPKQAHSLHSLRSFIAISRHSRRRSLRIRVSPKMRAASSSRVAHPSEPKRQKWRDGRKRPTIIRSTFRFSV